MTLARNFAYHWEVAGRRGGVEGIFFGGRGRVIGLLRTVPVDWG